MIRQDLHDSLKAACRMAIQHENHIGDVNLSRWAKTYGCEEEHVTAMWEHELTKLSLLPRNKLEAHDD